MSKQAQQPSLRRRGLGRGLDALMGDRPDYAPTGAGPSEIPLDEIDAGGEQPRRRFLDETLEELAQSIGSHGVLQPILVEPVGSRYRIIAGERRFRAARRAGLQRIPAMIRTSTDDERLTLALIENIQREDLTPMEEARAYRRLLDVSGISQEELAARVGKHRSTIANGLRLLGLPVEVQNALTDGTISAGHARALLMIPDPDERQRLFARIKQYSVREAEAYAVRVRDRESKREPDGKASASQPRPASDPHLRDLEQRLIDTLGTKVAVTGSPQRGKIEISFFNGDDLERLNRVLLGGA
jgi:ParB family chromosome partitioning protein